MDMAPVGIAVVISAVAVGFSDFAPVDNPMKMSSIHENPEDAPKKEDIFKLFFSTDLENV